MSERKLEITSELVWYDDQHTSGTVYRTGAGFGDDGKVHVPNYITFDGAINNIGLLGHFTNDVVVKGGFRARGVNLQLVGPYTVDPGTLYWSIDNNGTIGTPVGVQKPLGSLRASGMVTIVVKNAGLNAFNVYPENLLVEGGGVGDNIQLETGELVWLIWVGNHYRILQTTGTL